MCVKVCRKIYVCQNMYVHASIDINGKTSVEMMLELHIQLHHISQCLMSKEEELCPLFNVSGTRLDLRDTK